MAKAAPKHVLDNPKLRKFRDMLDGAGFPCKCLWQGRTELSAKVDDLAMFAVNNGPNGAVPPIRTFIVRDYGDGYGLWAEVSSNSFEDDFKRITGIDYVKPEGAAS